MLAYKHYVCNGGGNLLTYAASAFQPDVAGRWRYCCLVEGSDRAEVEAKYRQHLTELRQQEEAIRALRAHDPV